MNNSAEILRGNSAEILRFMNKSADILRFMNNSAEILRFASGLGGLRRGRGGRPARSNRGFAASPSA